MADSRELTVDWDILRGHPGEMVGYLLGLEEHWDISLQDLNSFMNPVLLGLCGSPSTRFQLKFQNIDGTYIIPIWSNSTLAAINLAKCINQTLDVNFLDCQLSITKKLQTAVSRKKRTAPKKVLKAMLWRSGKLKALQKSTYLHSIGLSDFKVTRGESKKFSNHFYVITFTSEDMWNSFWECHLRQIPSH